MKKAIPNILTALVFLFLFAPIAILLIFSFNESKSLSVFSEFSLHWYTELFNDRNTLEAVGNTLLLATSATVISTVMGTAAAWGIDRVRSRWYRGVMNTVTDIPMTNPDIITGISLMLMFVFVGRFFGAASSLNFWTMLIAHVTFCLPYVILQVLPKLSQMDKSLPEAAMDLGCTPMKAFFKVELPEMMPGIVTGAIMAFTISLDDFVISYFTSGTGFETLPIRIYSMTKKTVTPKMYALAIIIFFVTLSLLLISNFIEARGSEEYLEYNKKKSRRKTSSHTGYAKKVVAAVLSIALIAPIAYKAISGPKKQVLNVYNWGEYISDGSEDTLDTIKAFEQWYKETYGSEVTVNYSTYTSNEDMYNKISKGAVSYDVIIPSDYMIDRMASEGMLQELDFDNIPNYKYIEDSFRSLYYDPENKYTVPYTYGIVGIIYDSNVVDEKDTGSWDLMWNEKYANNILQYNNSRDAFGTAMYKLGIDVNTHDKSQWDKACEELIKQRPILKSFVMDEIYNMMESGEAAIGSYYAGDYFTMKDAQAEHVDLKFYYPEPTNYFVDAMCIPKCAQNPELAEIFINYMLSEEPAIANAEYINYASPNRLVYENPGYIEDMGEEAMEILYPELGDFSALYNQYAYRTLDNEMLDYLNTLWETVKIN